MQFTFPYADHLSSNHANPLFFSNSIMSVWISQNFPYEKSYQIFYTQNKDSFSFFPFLIPSIYFSYLLSLGRKFITMLNKTGERGYPCLVSDLRGKFSVFYHKSNVACKIFLQKVEEV